ncbi:MAG: DinB family protein [Pyrinomonadaceae bacterium MAG19_C2-C3]|nr:DinB family protein [Pyrinomonadaceae bacterium MAG19_C2-C3]
METEKIIDQLERAYHGDAWCGSSLRATLEGITAAQAARHPIHNAHSIWEIVSHVAAWMDAVRERIENHYVRLPAEGDWQEIVDTSEAAWARMLDKLEGRHQALCAAAGKLSDEGLERFTNTERDAATGGGVTIYVTLHGTAQHSLYHAAQIALLKKMI